ncbi:MAG: hypothetical protein GY697_12460 [Desulfobacterales bacterium]|nr:hypothetical protein [Desulfobacterales bacterium]
MKIKLMKCLAVMLVFGMLAVTGAIAGESSVTGTVAQTDKGMVIYGDDGETYIVMGPDIYEMVGKTVKATGIVEEGSAGKTLTVIDIEPAGK